jgi:hypothetical protein
MEEELKTVRPEVRIRAFRAIDEPETCELFIQGHTQVLTTSASPKLLHLKMDGQRTRMLL